MFAVVLLESRQFILVPLNWVENSKINGEMTRVFSSPQEDEIPVFDLTENYLFDKDKTQVYNGFLRKKFGKNFMKNR